MALLKFELKKEHLILLKFLNWGMTDEGQLTTVNEEGATTMFGGHDMMEDALIMIYGKTNEEFDPLSIYNSIYSDEQRALVQQYIDELPKALEVINFTQSFELGTYKSKWNFKTWKKI